MHAVRKVCDRYGLILVFDASLLADNLWFIKTREAAYWNASIRDITLESRAFRHRLLLGPQARLRPWRGISRSPRISTSGCGASSRSTRLPHYGGMSVREMEAITVGLDETMDEDMISQADLHRLHGPRARARGVPVITPPGGSAATPTR